MLKMPSFGMNTRPETFLPLSHCITDDFVVPSHARPSSDAASVHRCHELDECCSMCPCKAWHFSANLTQQYTYVVSPCYGLHTCRTVISQLHFISNHNWHWWKVALTCTPGPLWGNFHTDYSQFSLSSVKFTEDYNSPCLILYIPVYLSDIRYTRWRLYFSKFP